MLTVRQKILDYIIEQQSTTSDELSRAFRVTPANIRHHLSILIQHGSIKVIGYQASGKRGRRAQIFASRLQEDQNNLDRLSEALLSTLQHISSDKGYAVLLKEVAQRLCADFDVELANPTKRLYAAMQYLNQNHYQAHWEAHIENPRIMFDHCPYRAILDQYPELCKIDTLLLEIYLKTSVRQTEKLAIYQNGLPQCVFLINRFT